MSFLSKLFKARALRVDKTHALQFRSKVVDLDYAKNENVTFVQASFFRSKRFFWFTSISELQKTQPLFINQRGWEKYGFVSKNASFRIGNTKKPLNIDKLWRNINEKFTPQTDRLLT